MICKSLISCLLLLITFNITADNCSLVKVNNKTIKNCVNDKKVIFNNSSCNKIIEKITLSDYGHIHDKLASIILRNHDHISESSRYEGSSYLFYDDSVLGKFSNYTYSNLAKCLLVDNFEKIYQEQADAFVKVLIEHWEGRSVGQKGLLQYIDSSMEAINVLKNFDKYQPITTSPLQSVPQITQFIIRRMPEGLNTKLVDKYFFAMKDIRQRVADSYKEKGENVDSHAEPYSSGEVSYQHANRFFDEYFKEVRTYCDKKEFYKIRSLDYYGSYDPIDGFLLEYPVNKINVNKYKDLAICLAKTNSHKSVIKILQKVVGILPSEADSYLELADSYTILKQDDEVDKIYFRYLQQIAPEKKDIHEELKNRYSGVLLKLSQNSKDQKIIYSAIGDLNHNKEDDFVFILQGINGNDSTTLLIYFSDKQVFESKSALGDKNSEELSAINIDKNSLFFHFDYHRAKESYQFLLRKNNFILAGMESEYSGRGSVGTTSINFLTKKIKSERTYFEYDENTDEEKEIHTKEDKKFIMAQPIKLEDFNSVFEGIIDNAKAAIPDSYSLIFDNFVSDGYGNFSPHFINSSGKEFENAKLYSEVIDKHGTKDIQLIYEIKLSGQKKEMLDDNEIYFDGKNYVFYHNGSTAQFLPTKIKDGKYKFRLFIEHQSFGKVYSDISEIIIPLDVKDKRIKGVSIRY